MYVLYPFKLPWSAKPSSCSVKPSLQFWHSPPMRYFRIQRSLALKLYYEVPLSALGWTSVSYGWRRNHRKLQKIHGCHSEAPGWLPCKSTCLHPGKEQFLTNTHLPFLAVAYSFLFVDCFRIGTHCHTVLVLAIFKCESLHAKEETDLVYIGYYLYFSFQVCWICASSAKAEYHIPWQTVWRGIASGQHINPISILTEGCFFWLQCSIQSSKHTCFMGFVYRVDVCTSVTTCR